MDQLLLSQHELEHIGFTANYVPAEKEKDTISSVWYTLPVENGEFLYNSETVPYKWYFRSSQEEVSKLYIQILEQLYAVLSCFRADFNTLDDEIDFAYEDDEE